MIHEQYVTERLILLPLSENEKTFMYELLNSDGWLKYIGNRNIRTIEDAERYINNLLSNETSKAWIVKTKETNTSIGIITILKKSYLDYPDLGFAFMPVYMGFGYAYEASMKILDNLPLHNIETVAAVTVKENFKSGELLNKLGFKYFKTITEGNEELIYYLYKG